MGDRGRCRQLHGHGRQGGISLTRRAGEYRVDLLPRHQFNIILRDHNVERTVETIIQAARTGNTGDGMIFIYSVEDVVRIRTGERGHAALMYEGDIDMLAGGEAEAPASPLEQPLTAPVDLSPSNSSS